MNTAWKVFLSMSCSGGLLILVLLLGKRFWRDSLSRQWQYYIWLIVVLRLLLPFGPETSLMGKAYQAAGQAIAAPLPQQSPANAPGDGPAAGAERPDERESPTSPPPQKAGALPAGTVAWLVWLAAALGLLIRKLTIYQGFVRYIRAGWTPVSDRELLDRLSATAERAGVRKPVELCVHPLISSPLLMGFFRPCIVLPSADLPETNFQYIVLHELTHYRRLDIFYKWLVQLTVCLHWFNPLVHLMCRESVRDCEFSCDEAVLARAGSGGAPDYGKTLLDAMAAVGRYREHPGTVTLSENKRLLKERLGAIMNFKKKSGPVRLLTCALTLCLILGAAFAGVYPAAAAGRPGDGSQATEALRGKTDTGRYARMAEKSYEAGSLPLFQTAFCRLDQEAQGAWLDRIYADQDIAFMGAAVNLLDEDCPQILRLAEAVYGDGDLAFFSNLATRMSAATLEKWLGKALEDGNWAFQSMLFDALDRDGEFDELEDKREKEWEAAQRAEYQAAGVTTDGKDYYFQGQLAGIFLDVRANGSFYTLHLNPKGTVHLKIVRDAENKITGVSCMTEAEAAELLEDLDDGDCPETGGGRIWRPRVIPVNYKTIADGALVRLGEYTLSEGDRIWYDVSAETGKGLQIGFAKLGDARPTTAYYSVKNLRQGDEPLECTASFTVKPPAKGTYSLFLRATDGALGNVKGSISIGFAEEAS